MQGLRRAVRVWELWEFSDLSVKGSRSGELRVDHRKHFLSTTSWSLLMPPAVLLRGSSLPENGCSVKKKGGDPGNGGGAVAEECGPLPESAMQMDAK